MSNRSRPRWRGQRVDSLYADRHGAKTRRQLCAGASSASGLTVMDIVYNPRETKLLADAKAAGCRTISGLEMFLYQAAAQFERWTGQSAPASHARRVGVPLGMTGTPRYCRQFMVGDERCSDRVPRDRQEYGRKGCSLPARPSDRLDR